MVQKKEEICSNPSMLFISNIQLDYNKGNSQKDCVDKGKNPIVCEENDHLNQGFSQKFLPHIEEGNLSVNPQTDVNPHEKEDVQMENVQQLNEMNDLDYLRFLSDINYLDNLNFLLDKKL